MKGALAHALKTELAAEERERLLTFMETLSEESGEVNVDGTSPM